MFRETIHLGGVKPAEVVEAERPAIYHPIVVLEGLCPLLQIPVRDVQRRIAQNAGFISEARDEVHELLFDKDPSIRVANALVLEPSRPPREYRLRLGASMHTKEARL
jgi:hypothetical protein